MTWGGRCRREQGEEEARGVGCDVHSAAARAGASGVAVRATMRPVGQAAEWGVCRMVNGARAHERASIVRRMADSARDVDVRMCM